MGSLNVGLYLNTQHLREQSSQTYLGELIEQVNLANRMGFQSVWLGQHFLANDYKELQSIPLLGRLATDAEGMSVGTGVILLPLLNPVMIAEFAATIDIITGGHLVLGVGLGYRDAEYSAFGVKKTEAPKRLEKGIELIKQLWRGKPVSFEGNGMRIDGLRAGVIPIQKPRPKIWIGANSDNAVRRAARVADAWMMNPHATLRTLIRQSKIYKEVTTQARKAVTEVPLMRELILAETNEEVMADAISFLGPKYKVYGKWKQDSALPLTDRFPEDFEELARDRFVLGTANTCVEELHQYRKELGVTHFIFRVQWPGFPQNKALRSIRLLSEKVLPELR